MEGKGGGPVYSALSLEGLEALEAISDLNSRLGIENAIYNFYSFCMYAPYPLFKKQIR